MFKIIGLIVAFLTEMVFGKKQTNDSVYDSKSNTKTNYKRMFVSGIMIVSFAVNYLAIGRLYGLAGRYISLNNEKNIYKAKVEILDNTKVRAEQLEKSLEFCMNTSLVIQRDKSAKSK